eukprot:2071693-Alexandrium_andersonii.AAC.1
MLAVLRTGCSPTIRYLLRTRRVPVQLLHEQLGPSVASAPMRYEDTGDMCADIYTKAFDDVAKSTHACGLINVALPSGFQTCLRRTRPTGTSRRGQLRR